jgi:hypothetical protein
VKKEAERFKLAATLVTNELFQEGMDEYRRGAVTGAANKVNTNIGCYPLSVLSSHILLTSFATQEKTVNYYELAMKTTNKGANAPNNTF